MTTLAVGFKQVVAFRSARTSAATMIMALGGEGCDMLEMVVAGIDIA
jgi:acyl dehydratase